LQQSQFAPGPDTRGPYTFRVSGVGPDGAAICTASFPLSRASELSDAMWERSSPDARLVVPRHEWRRARIAAHARMAEALVELYRPAARDAVENVRFWLWMLELGTQTSVEVLARARYAFEIRVDPIVPVRVESVAGAVTVYVGASSARAPSASLDAVLGAAAGMLQTTVPELCATYALRRIVNESGDEGAVAGCADSRDILRGNRKRTIQLHKHEACSTCGRVVCNSSERTAVPPRGFYPRLVVCNVCPLGRDFRLWDGTRLMYESNISALSALREAKSATEAEQKAAVSAAEEEATRVTRGGVSAVSALNEVMIAVLLAIFRVAERKIDAAAPVTPLAAHLCLIPTKMVRVGFGGLLSPFYAAEPVERSPEDNAEPASKVAKTGTVEPAWPVAP
jgi:hypothetical protein